MHFMLERILRIDKELDGSIFLFGARQTGKSTALRTLPLENYQNYDTYSFDNWVNCRTS